MRKRDPDGISRILRRSIGQVVDILTMRKERLASRKKAVRLQERIHPPSTGLTLSEGLMWGLRSTEPQAIHIPSALQRPRCFKFAFEI